MSKMTIKTEGDTHVVITRRFAAPPETVYRAHTEPSLVQKWLLGPDGWTMPICEIDLRQGGQWRYGWRGPDGGGGFQMHGEFKEIVPLERIVHTEIFEMEGVSPPPQSLNTTVFTEKGGKTLVTVSVLYPSKEARDAAIATGMEDGWNTSYDRLAGLLPEWTPAPGGQPTRGAVRAAT